MCVREDAGHLRKHLIMSDSCGATAAAGKKGLNIFKSYRISNSVYLKQERPWLQFHCYMI